MKITAHVPEEGTALGIGDEEGRCRGDECPRMTLDDLSTTLSELSI